MIRLQDHAAEATLGALEGLFRTARHLPPDQLDWQPAPTARSARAQLLECACAPIFHTAVVEGDPDAYVGERRARYDQAIASLSDADLDALLTAARQNHRPLVAALKAVPDAALSQPMRMPFGAGFELPGAQLIYLPYWNLVYHTGQINYLQTLLGDTEMHL